MPFCRPMKSTIEKRETDILVRCREAAKDGAYEGPPVSIYQDGNWVNIMTDEYEGTAMFNIEALPAVRRALGMLAKQIKAKE